MKTATGVECFFGKNGDDEMEDKPDKPDKKDKPFFEKHELIIGTICIIILFAIAISVSQTGNSEPWGTYPTDNNNTDTNTTTPTTDTNTTAPVEIDFLKQIANEEWCMNQYLHRRPILYINAINNTTGDINKLRLQEALDLNLVQDQQEIYMENIDKTGLLCGNYLYFDFRNLYSVCLQIPDDLNRQECFKTETLDMWKWGVDGNQTGQ